MVGAIELIQGLLLAFAVVVILMPSYIRMLSFVGIGKKIREEGPSTHLVKHRLFRLAAGHPVHLMPRSNQPRHQLPADHSRRTRNKHSHHQAP